MRKFSWKTVAGLFALSLVVYLLFSYGGVRSPDSEVIYRAACSLALRGTFAVDSYLEDYGTFGFAPGRDGRLYSRYQPLHAILLAPLVRIADPLSRAPGVQRLFSVPPGSHYVAADPGVMLGLPPDDIQPHVARMLVSPFTPLVSALGVVLFFLVVFELTGSQRAAWLTALVYAFCTLNLAYAGTFFKEPLISALITAAFLFLLKAVPAGEEGRVRTWPLLLSGFLVSLAVATHLLAIPFVPFFALLAGAQRCRQQFNLRKFLVAALIWSLALVPVAFLLGWHNLARFGGVLDTGFRSSVEQVADRRFLSPVPGVSGLLFSAGKGVVFYCPVVLACLFLWRSFHRRYPLLSMFVLLMAGARLLFVGSFRDWHGGFCLGPRYFVNLVPFLLLPLGTWLDEVLSRRSRPALAGFCCLMWLFMCEQIYFALGEVFSYLHSVKWQAARAGIDVFKDDFLYFEWQLAPLIGLLNGNRGPFLLKSVPFSNAVLLGILCAVALLGVLWVYVRSEQTWRARERLATGSPSSE